ncbi:hypothetical protein [Falsiroseomonas sp.]|uniref:hypothetical protein n=1 Tax=Falsiroseomonas sp. TaxID=2870721 RepID=UPI003F6F000E
MQRITGATAVDIGGGKLGFVDENLGAGIEGTDVSAAFLNGVQEEILHVIEAAGLSPAAGNQLLSAISAMFGGRGALLSLAADAVIPNAVETAVPWPAPIYDDVGLWSAAQPTRITIPAGVSRIRVATQVTWNNTATGDRKMRVLRGTTDEGNGLPAQRLPSAGADDVTILNAVGGIVPVTPGEYLRLMVFHDHGFPLNLRQRNTFLHVEALR